MNPDDEDVIDYNPPTFWERVREAVVTFFSWVLGLAVLAVVVAALLLVGSLFGGGDPGCGGRIEWSCDSYEEYP